MCLPIQNPSQLQTLFGGAYVPEEHSDETSRNLPPAEREALDFGDFLKRLKERTENRDKPVSIPAFIAQLKAIHAWGRQAPADLSRIHHPVLVANGDRDKMVPSINSADLARRLPHAELVLYEDAGHGGIFQYHEAFVNKALAFLEA